MTGKEILIHQDVNQWADRNDAFLEHLIYIIGDSGHPPSEDDLLNMLIGFQAQQRWYRERLNMKIRTSMTDTVEDGKETNIN